MAAKKGARGAAPKVSKPRKVVIDRGTNKTGQSEAFDKAISASVTLLSHYYHAALSKYVDTDGNIVKSMPVVGDGPDAQPALSPLDSLSLDLAKIQQAAIFVNNLQRLRQDDSIDPVKNPTG